MKRNLALLLPALALIALLLAGCGASGGPETTDTPPSSTASESAPPETSPETPTTSDTPPTTSDVPPSPSASPTPEAPTPALPSDVPPSDTPPSPSPSPSPTPEAPPSASPSDTPPPDDTPSEIDTKSLLEAIVAGAGDLLADEDKLGMTFTDPVTADNSEGMLGLTAEEFGEYAVSAYASNAAIISIAHEAALIECVDDAAAKSVKALVAKGFNSEKWICVFPDRSLVVDSGRYVLLAASSVKYCDAVVASFTSAMGGAAGQPDIFYTRPEL